MRWFFALVSFIPGVLFSNTLIFTTAFNRPEFIELQHKLFKKFMKDEFEYIVFNDANNKDSEEEINKVCRRLGIQCVKIPQSIHTQPYLKRADGDSFPIPNIRNCHAVQWAWDHYILQHNDVVLLVDSDMFLIRPFSLQETLQEYDLAYVIWGTEDAISHQRYDYSGGQICQKDY